MTTGDVFDISINNGGTTTGLLNGVAQDGIVNISGDPFRISYDATTSAFDSTGHDVALMAPWCSEPGSATFLLTGLGSLRRPSPPQSWRRAPMRAVDNPVTRLSRPLGSARRFAPRNLRSRNTGVRLCSAPQGIDEPRPSAVFDGARISCQIPQPYLRTPGVIPANRRDKVVCMRERLRLPGARHVDNRSSAQNRGSSSAGSWTEALHGRMAIEFARQRVPASRFHPGESIPHRRHPRGGLHQTLRSAGHRRRDRPGARRPRAGPRAG